VLRQDFSPSFLNTIVASLLSKGSDPLARLDDATPYDCTYRLEILCTSIDQLCVSINLKMASTHTTGTILLWILYAFIELKQTDQIIDCSLLL
jgi:hypothetical protein